MRLYVIIFAIFFCCSCKNSEKQEEQTEVYIQVLGIAQDAGYPHLGCTRECCSELLSNKEKGELVTSLGLIDKRSNKCWLFEASPDIKYQWAELVNQVEADQPEGIFLTHAHIGHYAGLMDLGKEGLGSKGMKVYAMPRMDSFLRNNGPWSQLVTQNNIEIVQMSPSEVKLSDDLRVQAFTVPHRDEYSETVGYKITGPQKSLLFIPDIDKWEKWDRSIESEIESVDFALIDGTFYKNGEIQGRDMSEIPHPFIEESMNRFESLELDQRNKVQFIHFNHTNPVLRDIRAKETILSRGFHICTQNEIFSLDK